MEKRRDRDMAKVSESQSDLGDKTAGSEGGNIPGGSSDVERNPERGKQQDPFKESKQPSGTEPR